MSRSLFIKEVENDGIIYLTVETPLGAVEIVKPDNLQLLDWVENFLNSLVDA